MSIRSVLSPHQDAERAAKADTLGGLVLEAVKRRPAVAICFPVDGRAASLSYAELGVIARGSIALGVGGGDRVASAAGSPWERRP